MLESDADQIPCFLPNLQYHTCDKSPFADKDRGHS